MSATFVRARKKIWDADIDWLVDNIKFLLIDVQSLTQAKAITGATNATPISILSTGHTLTTGDFVDIHGVGGNTNANGHRRVTVTDANNYTLQDPATGANIAGNGAYTSGGFGISLEVIEFISDVTAAIVSRSSNLASKTSTRGIIDAADPQFATVSGATSELMMVAKDTGSDATSPVFLLISSFTSGMPVIPNGGNIDVLLNALGIAQSF